MHERVLQRIWRDQLYRRRGAMTEDGQRIEVLDPGRWNGEAGPDFIGARLRLAGRPVAGDVEVHHSREEWAAHGHDRDGAYEGVILHVVLVRGRSGRRVGGAGETPLPDDRVPVAEIKPS